MDDPLETPGQPSGASKPLLPVVAGALALAGIVAGTATLLFSQTTTQSFGWFAHAPLSDEVFLPGTTILGHGQITGLALLVAGLICAAFWAGLCVGRRTR